MKLRKMLVTVLAIVGIICFQSFPVSAEENYPVACPYEKSKPEAISCTPSNSYRVKSKSKTGTSFGSFFTLASNVSGASGNGQTLSGRIVKSYQNTVSGTVSASYGVISTSLGFNVTQSTSKEATYSITLNKGQKGTIYARPVYDVYQVRLERFYSGTLGCNFWRDAGTATVKRFVRYDYNSKVW